MRFQRDIFLLVPHDRSLYLGAGIPKSSSIHADQRQLQGVHTPALVSRTLRVARVGYDMVIPPA